MNDKYLSAGVADDQKPRLEDVFALIDQLPAGIGFSIIINNSIKPMETQQCKSSGCSKYSISNESLCIQHYTENLLKGKFLSFKSDSIKPPEVKPQQGEKITYPIYELYGSVKYIKKRGTR